MINMAKTYKDFVKTFKFRAKKESESPRAFIGARGKAMGKAWQLLKKERESKVTKSAETKKTTKKSPAKKKATKKSPAKKSAKKSATKRKSKK
jgi:hypothetical protein